MSKSWRNCCGFALAVVHQLYKKASITLQVQNEGERYKYKMKASISLKLNCMNNCMYKWQSQPPLVYIKGAGNLLLSAGIFFCCIPFSKFESFARLINLKCIGKGTYYNLREKYVFPVVTTTGRGFQWFKVQGKWNCIGWGWPLRFTRPLCKVLHLHASRCRE